ncbi:mucin-2-like [Ptychodera flava]|uniref:mucin-2-like n=1 Tax=Ptychodera flava TaxID=63121 RepID=UPI00396A9467
MVAAAPDLCPKGSRCSKIYSRAFCSAGQCEDGLIQIMDSSLCAQGYVCCREPRVMKDSIILPIYAVTICYSVIQILTPCILPCVEAGERGIGPHFHTFDGLRFTYGGNCMYTLVKEKADNPGFRVSSRHVPASNLENTLTAFHSSLEVKRFENILHLAEGNEKIYFNGQEIQSSLPFEAADGSVFVDWSDNQRTVLVTIPKVLVIDFNGKGKTTIALDQSQNGKVWGLLGNANGQTKDDLTYLMSDGNEKTIELESATAFNREDLQHFFNGWLVTCASG